MPHHSHGCRARHIAGNALSEPVIFGTLETDDTSPRPVVILQNPNHGFVLEGVSDLPTGCEVTVMLRNIGCIRGRVEEFGEGRLIAGFYVAPASSDLQRTA